jgi:uncharacterized phage protein (TIGR02218 family)
MAHEFSAAREAEYQKRLTFDTYLFKITPLSGPVEGYTSFNRDLLYDDQQGGGPITYISSSGGTSSALKTTAGGKADNQELVWAIDALQVTRAKLVTGYYDGARFDFMRISYKDLTMAPSILNKGRIAGIEWAGVTARAKMQSLVEILQRKSGARVVQTKCHLIFGGTPCGVPLILTPWSTSEAVTVVDPFDQVVGTIRAPTTFNDRRFECAVAGTTHGTTEPTWNLTLGGLTNEVSGPVVWRTERARRVPFTVDVPSDNQNFSVTASTDAPDAYFQEGRVLWSTGANAGRSMDILTWALASKSVLLNEAMRGAVLAGDTGELEAGCVKDKTACREHLNFKAWQGWGLLAPDPDEVINVTQA